jgi:GalNAc-alpha-(1->4)-GalNAc-alpha-(1->3)-diNAcBac-PP-undecaprenol alpha-1,4-N-acetyl-D-galactosaminyltransferase
MQMGGAERVLSLMANYWAARQWNVSILTLDNNESFYSLDPKVRHVRLDVSRQSKNRQQRVVNATRTIRRLRHSIKHINPDIVISFQTNTNMKAALAALGLHAKLIVSERIDPSIQMRRSRFSRWTQYLLYRRASAIVTQTDRVTNWFPENIRSRCVVIPNPVQVPSSAIEYGESLGSVNPVQVESPVIVAVGRLVHQKGHDILMRSFAALSERHRRWQLWLVGDGSKRRQLEALAEELGVSSRVTFWGAQKFPSQFLRKADLFVLPSRFEGFPNALCEAMACGLPVLATDCPSGPREIVQHNVDGYLIPSENPDAMTEALDYLLSDRALRARLARSATQILDRFGIDQVMGTWESVIAQVSSGTKLVKEELGQVLQHGSRSAA